MTTYTISTAEDIGRVAAVLEDGGECTEFDMSGGCEHLREIAEESGMAWMSCRNNMHDFTLNGYVCSSWYDEGASCYRPWNVFAFGIGTFSGACLSEALEKLLEKMQ